MDHASAQILSIEPDLKIQQDICEYLEDGGFSVLPASTGEEGFELFNTHKPDLVLSDLILPDMDGLEVLARLSKLSPETPIIIVSEIKIMKDAVQALRIGAWDLLLKPLTNLAVVEHAVCKALERARLVIENKQYRKKLESANQQLSDSLALLEEDQQAGLNVQVKLLPKEKEEVGDYRICHKILPSLYLSGDFVDHFQINDQKYGFYLADVSGHGASSAFVTVLLKSLVSQLLGQFQAGHHQTILEPQNVLKSVSDDILSAKLGKYLTMVYGVLDLESNILTYSVGGHYPKPILFDGEKSYFLEGEGFAVGILKRAEYAPQCVRLPEKFTLSLFSDGIMEILKGENLEQNEQTLLNLASNGHTNPQDYLEQLGLELHENLPDDVTMMTLHRQLLNN